MGLAGADLAFRRDGRVGSPASNLPLGTGSELGLSYAGYYRNTFSVSGLGYAGNLDAVNAVGGAFGYLLVPDIMLTSGLDVDLEGNPVVDPAKLQYASMSEILADLAYGRRFNLPRGIETALGATVIVNRRKLPDLDGAHLSGYGLALDLSGTVAVEKVGLRGVLVLENVLASYLRYQDEQFTQRGRTNVRFGLGWRRDIPYILGNVRVMYASPDLWAHEGVNATTVLEDTDSAETPRQLRLSSDPELLLYGNYGTEFCFARTVFVRVGVESARHLVFGAGLALLEKRLLLDLGYVHHQLGDAYSAALTYCWL